MCVVSKLRRNNSPNKHAPRSKGPWDASGNIEYFVHVCILKAYCNFWWNITENSFPFQMISLISFIFIYLYYFIYKLILQCHLIYLSRILIGHFNWITFPLEDSSMLLTFTCDYSSIFCVQSSVSIQSCALQLILLESVLFHEILLEKTIPLNLCIRGWYSHYQRVNYNVGLIK